MAGPGGRRGVPAVPSTAVLSVAAIAVAAPAVTALARRTLGQVRALREAGARVPPLDHTTSLPGEGATLQLAVLGDSAAAGHGLPHADDGLGRQVGRRLAARTGRPVAVTSLAVDGATTSGVLAEQVPALPADAEVVLVGVGVNDAVRGRRPREVAGATEQLLRAITDRAPAARLVLLTCPDLSSAPGLPGVLRAPLGASCRRVAATQRRVAAALDVDVVRADGHLPPETFGPDGFHPGPEGVRILANRVDRTLAGA